MGTKQMGETGGEVSAEDPGAPSHTPRKSDAVDEPLPMDDEARPGADLETAVEYPKEQIPIRLIMSMS